MRKIIFTLWMALFALCVSGQEKQSVNLQMETRFDYQREYLDGESIDPNSGFKGKYLNVMLNGTIDEHWSYSYRQRLNKMHADASFFDATDWIHLTYKLNEQWSFNAGKQVVGIGGYEYDRAPIDLYFCSEYWNNIPCYQLGVSTTYTTLKGNDSFVAQICESPFNFNNEDLYAYNLLWYGSHGWYNSIWSVNAQEFAPGQFIYYLALGNEFRFGNAKLQLDFMNRATDDHAFFLKDCSVMGELSCMVGEKWNVFGRMTYDVNKTNSVGDFCVLPGTELTRVGAGLEYYPLSNGNRNIRFHLYGCHAIGKNGNPNGTMLPDQTFVDLGVKFKVDVLSLTNKIFK
ncbi:MAG: porin [Bacteroides sp.]|nr:porin [Bacteroides sp.]